MHPKRPDDSVHLTDEPELGENPHAEVVKVVVRMRSHDGDHAERRTVTLEAASYHDAYEQALDAVPDGWELVSVKSHG